MNMSDSIFRAQEEDAAAVWKIRYHPLVNQTALQGQPVALPEHRQWFRKRYLDIPNNVCLVFKRGGKVLGYCRLDENEANTFTVSIAVHPDYHRQGLGQLLLTAALREGHSPKKFLAHIKKNNPSSLLFFQRNGFVVMSEADSAYTLVRAF